MDTLVDVDSWPAIAAALKGRWPDQAVAVDLEYWRSLLAARRLARMPGRRRLAARWGWSDWEARAVLGDAEAPEELPVTSRPADEEAPRFGHLRVVASQSPPADRPEPSRAVPSDLPSDLPSLPPGPGDGWEKREFQGVDGSERDRDAVAAFDRLVARRSAAEVPQRFRWRVEPGTMGWFRREVLGRPEFAELDVAAELEYLDQWSEEQIEAAESGDVGARPIRKWKGGVLNWLRREISYEAEEKRRVTSGTAKSQSSWPGVSGPPRGKAAAPAGPLMTPMRVVGGTEGGR